MNKGKFRGIQVNKIYGGNTTEIIVDFDNNRHHGGCVDKNFTKAGVVLMLRTIAKHIENDELIE